MVEQWKLSSFSFLDHRSIDRMTRVSINLKPRKRNMMSHLGRLFDPYMNLKSFDNIVEAAANGLTLHHNVTPETLKTFKEASKLVATVLTPNTQDESKRVWDKFITYAQNRGFNPLEATSDDVVTWVIQRSQETTAPAQVQFELQAIKTWRLHAGKPLGYIPFETLVSKGLLNFMNPSHSSIKGFEPNQLQAIMMQAIVHEEA